MSVTPAPHAPTASPAPFVPVEALTAPRDRFRCDRLHATLTAEDCIERQKRADVAEAAREKQPGVSPFASRWSTQFATCRRCPVGMQIARRFPKVARAPMRRRNIAPRTFTLVNRQHLVEVDALIDALAAEEDLHIAKVTPRPDA